jgi:putative ATPase
LDIDPGALDMLTDFANGDARRALNTLEIAAGLARTKMITMENVQEALQKRTLLYDKSGEEHFNQISALHKSLRNSDVDAALIGSSGCWRRGDPLYVAAAWSLRLEDIGLADPRRWRPPAKEAYDFLTPEGWPCDSYLPAAPRATRSTLWASGDREALMTQPQHHNAVTSL